MKGIERLLGTAQNPDPQLIEVTAGQAKYEHAFHSIVWRIPRLPKEGQGLGQIFKLIEIIGENIGFTTHIGMNC